MLKKVLTIFFVLLSSLIIWQYELIFYGVGQGVGQFQVLWNARPIAQVMDDPSVPDSLKNRLKFIEEIKRFAIDSLGLNNTQNYTDLYDQHEKPILWTLTVAQPYRLEVKYFSFPIIGSFTYKGFFDENKLHLADSIYKAKGFDTQISEVSAWSTLGWFRDPVLSSMLYRSDGSLADLIIHEMTHSTLFVKNQHEFNENLAEFIGDYGAKRFLAYKYGNNSEKLIKYITHQVFIDKYTKHLVRGAKILDSLYSSFPSQVSSKQKQQLKINYITNIMQSSDSLFVNKIQKRRFDASNLPNNAYFVGYLAYRGKQNLFKIEFYEKFNGNFKRYLSYLKQKYPNL